MLGSNFVIANGQFRNSIRSSSPVVTVRVAPVSTLCAVTFAPGTLCPEGSFTVPRNVPVDDCAIATGLLKSRTNNAVKQAINRFPPVLFMNFIRTPPVFIPHGHTLPAALKKRVNSF